MGVFQTLDKIVSLDEEGLSLCPGFGPQKVCYLIVQIFGKVNEQPPSLCELYFRLNASMMFSMNLF